MSLQALNVPKTATSLNVTFPTPFAAPPIVIVTPFWVGAAAAGVGASETVTAVSATGCTIVSANAAPTNYSVNVLAIDAGNTSIGGLPIYAGVAPKPAASLSISLPVGTPITSSDPAALLTPYYPKSTVNPGGVETLNTLARSELNIISPNYIPTGGYNVNYVAANLGFGSAGGQVVQTGIVNKTGGGSLRVYFPQSFATAPRVFLSPWWNSRGLAVVGNDTVTAVTTDYFDYTSSNAAFDYFTTWMAVGA